MYDAKQIMKEYLKSKKAYKKLRVGDISKIPVSTAYVNDKTGKITFKR